MTAITRTAYPRLSSGMVVGRELLEEFTPTGPGTPEGVFRGNLGVVEFWVWALS